MSELIQVRKKAQLTLPTSVRKKLNIEEGDLLDVQVKSGEIILRVKKIIDKEQAWFWSERWQAGEKEAEDDIRAGRGQKFTNAQSAVSFLRSKTIKSKRKSG